MRTQREITFGSLFAGIGGFDAGFSNASMLGSWAVEIDPQCRRVLAARFPEATLYDDVRECGRKSLDRVDVICGGFPCQDLSIAGKRAGLGGSRSGLFYEMARIVRELRPRLLVWENVPGLLSSDRGRDFARVIFHLGSIGYFGAWRVLDTQFFGAPQRRRRVFGVFARGRAGAGVAAEILALTQSVQRHSAASREKGEGVAGTLAPSLRASGVGTGRVGDTRGQDGESVNMICFQQNQRDEVRDLRGVAGALASEPGMKQQNYIAHTLSNVGHDASEDGTGRGVPLVPIDMRQASRGATMTNNRKSGTSGGAPGTGIGNDGDNCPTLAHSHTPGILTPMSVRRLMPIECCRLQGFPDDWLDIDPPLSDSAKYRMLGNAVSVPVAEWLGRRIVAAMQQQPGND